MAQAYGRQSGPRQEGALLRPARSRQKRRDGCRAHEIGACKDPITHWARKALANLGHGHSAGNFCTAQGKLCNAWRHDTCGDFQVSRSIGRPSGTRGDCRDRQPPPSGWVQTAPSLCLTLRFAFGCGHLALTIRAAAAMAGLSALTAGLGSQLGVLRKAALLVRNALAALTARDSG